VPSPATNRHWLKRVTSLNNVGLKQTAVRWWEVTRPAGQLVYNDLYWLESYFTCCIFKMFRLAAASAADARSVYDIVSTQDQRTTLSFVIKSHFTNNNTVMVMWVQNRDRGRSVLEPNVSPPGCATSRQRHRRTSHSTLTPSTECHRKSVLWTNPTKIGYHGNVSRGIEKLKADWSSTGIVLPNSENLAKINPADFEIIVLTKLVKNKYKNKNSSKT